MIEFPEIFYISLFLFPDFLDGDDLSSEFSAKNGALSAGAQPGEVGDRLDRYFPIICSTNKQLLLHFSLISFLYLISSVEHSTHFM